MDKNLWQKIKDGFRPMDARADEWSQNTPSGQPTQTDIEMQTMTADERLKKAKEGFQGSSPWVKVK